MKDIGFYLFGGRGDADRFYYVKLHPAVGKTGMGFSAKIMAKAKFSPHPNTLERKMQNEYVSERKKFINENKKHTARESTPSAFNFFKFSLRFFIFKGV